jgi:C4-dicarboxylate-specific signal transduction histidine kinase
MNLRTPLLAALLMAGAASLIFHFFQRQVSTASFAFGSHPEVRAELDASLDDQRRLADLDPENSEKYRARFGQIETTVHRLQILDHNRAALTKRYETVVLGIFVISVILVTGIYALRQSRHQPRLARLQKAITDLAQGKTDLEIGERGGDTIGRIASMIERTSRIMAQDRRRLAALNNLSAWQEAARRHAHEMRTPLTGLQLELSRVTDLLKEVTANDASNEARRAVESAEQEAAKLAEFTHSFTSFARLPEPSLRGQDLGTLIADFVSTYSSAWKNLSLESSVDEGLAIEADRDQLRQVLVNLCDNSSLALGGRSGSVTFSSGTSNRLVWVEVSDDGPGVSAAVRSRIFEPYSTTRGIGEGMGLGLAICKKILLDHGGDLELVRADEPGARFRLTLPKAEESTS